MALKTTIGPKGVVTETVTGSQDQLQITVSSQREDITKLVNSSGVVSIYGGLNLLITRAAAGVTASLPAVSSDTEGERVLIMLDGLGNNVVLVTGSAGALNIDGAATTNMSGAYGHLELLSVPADNSGSYSWHIVDRKPAI